MSDTLRADVAVIGGTGFYEFLTDAEQVDVATPFGPASGPVSVGDVDGRRVAFLPRHGAGHALPPHRIDYRANLWLLRSLGVRQVVAPYAVGGLLPSVAPGDLVAPDQLVDRTTGRVGTFVETGAVHAPLADPYCPRMLGSLARRGDVAVGGTMVVIDGPRFNTRAESRHYADQGWSLVNMTAQPEASLARELRLCFAAVALVTDMDAGVDAATAVTQDEVFAAFARNLERLKDVVRSAIGDLPDPDGCGCAAWAEGVDPALLP